MARVNFKAFIGAGTKRCGYVWLFHITEFGFDHPSAEWALFYGYPFTIPARLFDGIDLNEHELIVQDAIVFEVGNG